MRTTVKLNDGREEVFEGCVAQVDPETDELFVEQAGTGTPVDCFSEVSWASVTIENG